MDKTQKYQEVFIYDLHSDPASLGSLRDSIEIGDTFDYNNLSYEVTDVERVSQYLMVKRYEKPK